MYIYMYVYIYMYMYIYVYIYMYNYKVKRIYKKILFLQQNMETLQGETGGKKDK